MSCAFDYMKNDMFTGYIDIYFLSADIELYGIIMTFPRIIQFHRNLILFAVHNKGIVRYIEYSKEEITEDAFGNPR